MGKIQDALSAVKSAFTGDSVGSKVARGIAATAVAGAVGGSGGVQALGGVLGKIKAAEKERDLERVKKVKEELEKERYQVGTELDREQLLAQKLKNYDTVQNNIIGGAFGVGNLDKAKKGISGESKFRTTATENTPAVEPKIDLRIPKPTPLTATSGAVGDSEKNIAAAQMEGVKLGADVSNASGIAGIGPESFKGEKRRKLAQEISQMGLNPFQANAAHREMNEQAMPGFHEKNRQIVENTVPEIDAMTKLKVMFPRVAAGIAGAGTAGAIGATYSAMNPIVTGLAAISGGLAGYLGIDAITEGYDRVQDKMSGVGSEAKVDVPLDQESMMYGDQIAINLAKSGVKDYYEANALAGSLMARADLQSIPAPQREKLVRYIVSKFQPSQIRTPYEGGGLFGTAAR